MGRLAARRGSLGAHQASVVKDLGVETLEQLERHEMQLEATWPSGAEEWYCPRCGRMVLMQWPPHSKKVVVEPGNDRAIHAANKRRSNAAPPPLDIGTSDQVSASI